MGRRVVVIGGGAAGTWAALAAQRAGADVTLIRQAPGASALSSGCLDFAAGSAIGGTPVPIVEAAQALAQQRRWHPFSVLGSDLPAVIRRAMGLLLEEHGLQGSVQPGENLLLATPFGTLKQTALAQPSIAAGDLRTLGRKARVGVVGLSALRAFDADVVVAGLVREGYDAVAVRPALRLERPLQVNELASKLDDDAFRSAFVAQVADAARKVAATLVLLPVAGLREPEALLQELEQGGTRAAELLSVPPSIPGLRFEQLLERSWERAGIHRLQGRVKLGEQRDGRVTQLALEDGRSIETDAVILATGRFIGGGIRHEHVFEEPALGLPVAVDGQDVGDHWVGDLLQKHAGQDQAALRAGLMVDARMRPVDGRGRLVYSNVFAAGAVIGGFDPARDESGLGVVAVTALIAGENAAQVESGGSR